MSYYVTIGLCKIHKQGGFNDENVYIENEIQKTQNVILYVGGNNDSILIYPPKGGYDSSHEYTIYIRNNFTSICGNKLANGIMMKFYIEREESLEAELLEDLVTLESSDLVGLQKICLF